MVILITWLIFSCLFSSSNLNFLSSHLRMASHVKVLWSTICSWVLRSKWERKYVFGFSWNHLTHRKEAVAYLFKGRNAEVHLKRHLKIVVLANQWKAIVRLFQWPLSEKASQIERVHVLKPFSFKKQQHVWCYPTKTTNLNSLSPYKWWQLETVLQQHWLFVAKTGYEGGWTFIVRYHGCCNTVENDLSYL